MQSTAIISSTPSPILPSTRPPLLRRRHLPIRASIRTDELSVSSPHPPPPAAAPPKLNRYSSRITEPKSQGASQAVLYGVGLSDSDLRKPQVGISSVWYEGNTCNMHLLQLAEAVRDGVREAGMVGFRFNTVGVSDAISMGTRGMCYSLQSRDLIADSIETVMAAQWYDGNISIPGCDKNMPGTIMAMGRLNRPSIMIYGGTIKPGHFHDDTYDIVSAFQCYGEYVSGSITDDQRMNVLRNSCPGAGACGGMYTANTMASAIETMGMSLPYSSSTPAEDPLKLVECHRAGNYLLELLKMDLKPRDIITEKSLRNAMVIVMALGGSTNAVLHLIAIARSVGLLLTLDDFQKVSDEVPFLADLKPSGKYVMEDLHKVGGTPAVIRFLLEKGYLDGDCITVTGKTLAENAKHFPPLAEGQQIIRPLENPIKKTGHIQILYGNLAPGGSVAKITGKEGLYFSGPALVFDGEEAMIAAISENPMRFKGKVVVIRGEGPKGGPGMPEMLTPTSAIMGAGLGKRAGLKSMIQSEEWLKSKFFTLAEGMEMEKIILDNTFWRKLEKLQTTIAPFTYVLRMVDGDKQPAMSLVYDAFDRAKLAVSEAYENKPERYMKFWKIIDARWESTLHSPLHAAGYFLNPAIRYRGDFSTHPEVRRGLQTLIGRLLPDMNDQIDALSEECALLTDGRFSGGSHGYVVGHICPEAQEGGPIGLIQNGDVITIDVLKRRMDVALTEDQLAERRNKWSLPPYKARRGVLYKYIKNVQSASEGCVTDE